ncbi:hypothetical protein ACP4OV_026093 [Aristida adscensionis]
MAPRLIYIKRGEDKKEASEAAKIKEEATEEAGSESLTARAREQKLGTVAGDKDLGPFMAASQGSPGPVPYSSDTQESGDSEPSPNKRKKIEGGSNREDAEGNSQQRTAAAAVGEGSRASPAAPVSTPPRLRIPPYPKSRRPSDVREWTKERRRISDLIAKDPRNNLPTLRKPMDPGTTAAVQSPRDKLLIRNAARFIVSVSSMMHDGSRRQRCRCTGIVMGQCESNGKQHTMLVTCSRIVCKDGALLDPVPKVLLPLLSVVLPNKTILDGRLLFFNDHYDIALLAIDVDFPLQCPSIGSGPNYGQDIFVLSRDKDSTLMVRNGEILWSEQSDYIGRNYYMFLSCEIPKNGNGGPVIDHDGNVTGMAFECWPSPGVLSISIIVTCIGMWSKFSRIARPLHGLHVRTMELLDVSLQEEIFRDYHIDSGFIIDIVSEDSPAEKLGILPGDVIVSFDERHALTLPQLEDHLLSIGWRFLQDPNSVVELKIEVYDPMKQSKRSITFPLEFCDASERVLII